MNTIDQRVCTLKQGPSRQAGQTSILIIRPGTACHQSPNSCFIHPSNHPSIHPFIPPSFHPFEDVILASLLQRGPPSHLLETGNSGQVMIELEVLWCFDLLPAFPLGPLLPQRVKKCIYKTHTQESGLAVSSDYSSTIQVQMTENSKSETSRKSSFVLVWES